MEPRYIRTQEVLATQLSEAETVMLDTDRGAYYGVRGSARILWDRLAEPATIDELANQLLRHYSGLDRERARVDAQAFVDDLISEELVRVDNEGIASA